MTEIENNSLLHRIYFDRYENSEVKKVIKVLESANKKIASKIREGKTVATKKRYYEIAKSINEIIDDAKLEIKNSIDIDALLSEEVESTARMLTNGVSVDTTFTIPGTEQLKKAALFKPIEALNGKTFEQTFDFFAQNLYTAWDSSVRTGYLLGQTTDEIVRGVLGSLTKINDLTPNKMSQLRKSLELNTRTVLQQFADEAHRAVFEENDSKIKGYKILATLDRRTCLICGSLEKNVYKKLSDVPSLPVHYSCRCTLIPVVNMSKDYDSKRASEFGEVDGKLTYDKWLAMQNDEVQKEILGPSRYEMYKKGTSIEKQFISDGRILTVEELRRR